MINTIARRLVTLPEGFEPNPKLARGTLKDRAAMADGQKAFDWGSGENLAFASLLADGHRYSR